MYILESDILKGIYPEELDAIKRDGADVDQAILESIEEVRSYLCDRYDIDSEFSKSGASRNNRIINLVRDITIYNLFKNSSPNKISDIRQSIYKDAVKALERIQAEKASIPNLSRIKGDNSQSSYLAFGGNNKRNNHY